MIMMMVWIGVLIVGGKRRLVSVMEKKSLKERRIRGIRNRRRESRNGKRERKRRRKMRRNQSEASFVSGPD